MDLFGRKRKARREEIECKTIALLELIVRRLEALERLERYGKALDACVTNGPQIRTGALRTTDKYG